MPGPLNDITVLDVSRILSGPFCTMLLRDLGARVVKVESPRRGDMARHMGPLVDEKSGDAAYFVSINRGKESVGLDIFTPEGQGLLKRLTSKADVLVENYVPGTMARLGLDYASLKRDNPRLVYASISGFGQDGPNAQRPALDIIVQAMGGLMSVTGEQGGPPLRPGASLGDSTAGLFTGMAILAALHERELTGAGQHIDMSMLDCQVTLMENAFSRYFATGEEPERLGSRHPAAAPFQAFETADGHMVVALLTDDEAAWRRFCAAVGLPGLADDPRFGDNRLRTANHDALEPVLAEGFHTQTTEDWLRRLQGAGVPCAPVNSVSQVAADPQVAYRGMIREIPHAALGSWPVANTPFRFSASQAGAQGASPALGEHTEAVLRSDLGLSAHEIEWLREKGVI
jgi:CoA:oxalate CoA-transferase